MSDGTNDRYTTPPSTADPTEVILRRCALELEACLDGNDRDNVLAEVRKLCAAWTDGRFVTPAAAARDPTSCCLRASDQVPGTFAAPRGSTSGSLAGGRKHGAGYDLNSSVPVQRRRRIAHTRRRDTSPSVVARLLSLEGSEANQTVLRVLTFLPVVEMLRAQRLCDAVGPKELDYLAALAAACPGPRTGESRSERVRWTLRLARRDVADRRSGRVGAPLVAAGSCFSLTTRPQDGAHCCLAAFGNNDYGQLGFGSTGSDVARPVLSTVREPMLDLSAGCIHMLVLTVSGQVLTNYYSVPVLTPIMLGSLNAVRFAHVSVSSFSLLLLSDAGSVYSFGSGALGHGNKKDLLFPKRVEALVSAGPMVTIEAGRCESFAVGANGRLWSWGSGSNDLLGYADLEYQLVPKEVTTAGISQARLTAVSTTSHELHCHAVALDASGHVWSWGNNWCGSLGNGTISDEKQFEPKRLRRGAFGPVVIVQIAAGVEQTLAISRSGALFSWGLEGTLGYECRNRRNVVMTRSWNGDSVLCMPVPTRVEALRSIRIMRIATGFNHSIVASDRGIVFSFGSNNRGQLGLGDTENRSTPRVVPSLLSTAQKLAGRATHERLTALLRAVTDATSQEEESGLGLPAVKQGMQQAQNGLRAALEVVQWAE